MGHRQREEDALNALIARLHVMLPRLDVAFHI